MFTQTAFHSSFNRKGQLESMDMQQTIKPRGGLVNDNTGFSIQAIYTGSILQQLASVMLRGISKNGQSSIDATNYGA